MPIAPTYPGVYIEEVPSGVRIITGVATSVTAFVGRAVRGPVDEPVPIHGFGDFERTFGGLWERSPMSYAVWDYFTNGGSRALVVRLFHPPATGNGVAVVTLPGEGGDLLLEAASPGAWGNGLAATVDRDGIDDEVAELHGLEAADLFNLTLTDPSPGGGTEQLRNLSVLDGSRRVDEVLARGSRLARVRGSLPGSPPADGEARAEGGEDGAGLAAKDYQGSEEAKTGVFALEKADLFNLLCIPPDERDGDTEPAVYQSALDYCRRRRAVLLVDPPVAWGRNPIPVRAAKDGLAALNLSGPSARNAALYFPRLVAPDPLREGQAGTSVPCGAVAGVIARTDAERGVWKAPAGTDAALAGVQGLEVELTDAENGELNPLGINCLRNLAAAGRVVWGARTLRGADRLGDEYKYLPVRRLALYLEESLYRGTRWVVFEENDEPLWTQIRLDIGSFLDTLFRRGAFQGSSPREAYFVRCDRETTTQEDVDRGVVNIVVGFAPLKPAEFVILKIQQIAGRTAA
ncbi:MAG: phage tail sheath subtilisin-like domain-containing protein [Acidobacteriota bacterium]|jgi:phage tail sheath protein FI